MFVQNRPELKVPHLDVITRFIVSILKAISVWDIIAITLLLVHAALIKDSALICICPIQLPFLFILIKNVPIAALGEHITLRTYKQKRGLGVRRYQWPSDVPIVCI